MLNKIITIITLLVCLKIIYTIVSKLFLKGVKFKKFIEWVINKFRQKKGGP